MALKLHFTFSPSELRFTDTHAQTPLLHKLGLIVQLTAK